MKRYLLLAVALMCGLATMAQGPVKWSASITKQNDSLYKVVLDARIERSWHIYDLGPYTNSVNPTTVEFEPSAGYSLVGEVTPDRPSTVHYDELYQTNIGYWENRVSLSQLVQPRNNVDVVVTVEWMACNDGSCTPPSDQTFTLPISDFVSSERTTPVPPAKLRDLSSKIKTITNTATPPEPEPSAEEPAKPVIPEPKAVKVVDATPLVPATPVNPAPEPTPEPETPAQEPVTEAPANEVSESAADESAGGSMWALIIEAVLWGFAALLTPCVFPMVPMTVSFFIKGSENKRRGRFKALMYGVFIVLLYTLPIAVIILATRLIGGEAVTADIFNWLATHWLPNLVFFVVFMVFAASFFGAFEITMPSSLVNKADRGSEREGLGGLFFMAVTLVLVSFSCTGPIVGTVIVKSTSGEFWEPIVTMLAFSVAFALPFTLLALFPSMLKSLPKSGGWLNSVKVVLGFVEVALGFKFLSVADQTYHWGLLDREVYLAIWIVVFTLMGLYLLGKIRFAHDSEVKHIGVLRLSLAIAVFSFVVYMIPGMWGAPLKALSGYLPPISTQDFVVGKYASAESAKPADNNIKYADVLHLPHGLNGYFDLEQGLEAARREGKPVFLDFTGHGCVNCREMEARVWSDAEVLRRLREDYIIIALYSDDKLPLPKSEWLTTEGGKILKSIGKKNSYIVNSRYGISSQPAYLLLDTEGTPLVPTKGYDLDIQNYIDFLQSGVDAYNASR
ncbi:MAG: thioredoxin family protein [Rikenellaceae bacterium]|nr:thioredoxin family protein [Rikenellaceae bacterium]